MVAAVEFLLGDLPGHAVLVGVVREGLGGGDEEVLVVGTVEHPDVAGPGQSGADAPQEVVGPLLLRGGLERGQRDALGVDQPDHVAHDAAFPGRVQALEDQQHRVGGTTLGGGEETFLEVGEELTAGGGRGLRGLASRIPARGGVAPQRRQVQVGADPEELARVLAPLGGDPSDVLGGSAGLLLCGRRQLVGPFDGLAAGLLLRLGLPAIRLLAHVPPRVVCRAPRGPRGRRRGAHDPA